MEKLHYFIQVNGYLVLCWLFYVLFLRKETFHQWNRFFLLFSALASLLLPILQEKISFFEESAPVVYKESIPTWALPAFEITTTTPTYDYTVFERIYWAGVLISAILLLRRSWQTYRFVQQKKPGAWTFMRSVFVHPQVPNYQTVLLHEQTHAHQWHSLDLIVWELLLIFCWMNPAVYGLRIASRNIHEFIADECAARTLPTRADYATLLVHHQFGVSPKSSLEHHFFSHFTLKTRIRMIMKNRSNRSALLKYGLILPIFVATIALSSAQLAEKSKPAALQSTWEALQDDVEIILTPLEENQPVATTSQDTTKKGAKLPIEKAEIFTQAEDNPEFPGGIPALFEWLGKEIKYPEEAKNAKQEGKIFARFVIQSDGTIGNVEILKGISPALDAEAIRVIKKMPTWKPGKQNGKPVNVFYNMPLVFSLGEPKAPKKPIETENVNINIEIEKIKEPTEPKSPPSPPAAPKAHTAPPAPPQNLTINMVPSSSTGGSTSVSKDGDLYKTLDPKKKSVFVDDKEITSDQISTILSTIQPSDILSIDVLRGEKAMEKAGKESVLLIRTKKK